MVSEMRVISVDASTLFQYKIERKEFEFNKCKVRLVAQGQDISLYKDSTKALTESAIMTTLSARCLLLMVLALFLVLPLNSICLLIMSTFLKLLYKVNCYLGTVVMENSMFPLHRVIKWILDPFIVSSSHFQVWHAVSRPCVAYDDECFSGNRRLKTRGVCKEYVVSRY